MFLKVLSLVKKGYSIKKAIKLCSGLNNSGNFYKNLTEKQKQILIRSKLINFPYFKYDDSLEEQIKQCKNNIHKNN